jgi:hypothetical protein
VYQNLVIAKVQKSAKTAPIYSESHFFKIKKSSRIAFVEKKVSHSKEIYRRVSNPFHSKNGKSQNKLPFLF